MRSIIMKGGIDDRHCLNIHFIIANTC